MRQDSTKRQRSPSLVAPSKHTRFTLDDDIFGGNNDDNVLNEALDGATSKDSNSK